MEKTTASLVALVGPGGFRAVEVAVLLEAETLQGSKENPSLPANALVRTAYRDRFNPTEKYWFWFQ